MSPTDTGGYPPDMLRAERELDAAIDDAMALARETEALVEESRQHRAADEPTEEELVRLRAYLCGHARTPAWEAVIARIDRGELTWRDVAKDILGTNDPGVAAAYESLRDVPPPTEQVLIDAGFRPPEPPPAESTPDDSPAPRPTGRVAADDDDYFDSFTSRDDRSW